MKRWWAWFFLLVFFATAYAQVGTRAWEAAYLVEPNPGFQFKDALSNDQFTPFDKDLRLGFLDKPVWIKLRIKPTEPELSTGTSSSDSAVVLRIGLLSLDTIDLFEQVNGAWVTQYRGDMVAQKYPSCRDDFHCFELQSNPNKPIDLLLRVQTTGITTVILQAVTVRDLPVLVADRMVTLVSTFAVALSLLLIGVLFFVIERSHLVVTFCAYQISVVLLTLLSTGLGSRFLDSASPDTLNLVYQYLLTIRAILTVAIGYVLLRPYTLHHLYRKAIAVLAGLCLISVLLVLSHEFFSASRLNIAIHVLAFGVQILGAATAQHMSRLLRWITLIGYTVFIVILMGSVSLAFNLYPQLGSHTPLFMQSLGDWRLNGSRVGLFLFAILIIQVFERRKIHSETLQAFKLEAAKSTAQRERLTERQSMIDMLTHELKNPLGTIRFAVATLRRNASIDGDSLHRVKRIDDSIDRMNTLIEHVALSNKIDRFDTSQERESIDVAELVDVSMGEYDDFAVFDADTEPGLTVQTSRLMLSLILQNLISNAYKYHLSGTKISIRAYANNESMVMAISNTIEMDKSPDPSKLFQAYYRHNNVQDKSGMGLGLSLAMSAAEKIHATIGFAQDKNVVVFTVKVPL